MAPTAFAAGHKVAPVAPRSCRAHARCERQQVAAKTAGLAAAVLLAATPAFAGVQVTDKPKAKQYVSKDAQQEAPSFELPNPADKLKGALKGDSGASESSGGGGGGGFSLPSLPGGGGGGAAADSAGGGFDVQSLWPLGIVGVGGVFFALPKLDPKFDTMYDTIWVKSSRSDGFGIGTEDTLKNDGGYMAPYYENRNIFGEKQAQGTKAIKQKSVMKKPNTIPGSRTSPKKRGIL